MAAALEESFNRILLSDKIILKALFATDNKLLTTNFFYELSAMFTPLNISFEISEADLTGELRANDAPQLYSLPASKHSSL